MLAWWEIPEPRQDTGNGTFYLQEKPPMLLSMHRSTNHRIELVSLTTGNSGVKWWRFPGGRVVYRIQPSRQSPPLSFCTVGERPFQKANKLLLHQTASITTYLNTCFFFGEYPPSKPEALFSSITGRVRHATQPPSPEIEFYPW